MKIKAKKELSIKELDMLGRVLNRFEKTYHKSCGATAEMFDYDVDHIDIEVSFMDTEQTEQFTLERSILLDKSYKMQDKVEAIG